MGQQQGNDLMKLSDVGGKTKFIEMALQKRAQRIRELAQVIRNDPTARDSIAEGFELIAQAMEPCEDCGHQDADAFAVGGGE